MRTNRFQIPADAYEYVALYWQVLCHRLTRGCRVRKPFTGLPRATRYGEPEIHRPEGRCCRFGGESRALSPTRNLSFDNARARS